MRRKPEIWMLNGFINHMSWIIIRPAGTTNRCARCFPAKLEVEVSFTWVPFLTSEACCFVLFYQWTATAPTKPKRTRWILDKVQNHEDLGKLKHGAWEKEESQRLLGSSWSAFSWQPLQMNLLNSVTCVLVVNLTNSRKAVTAFSTLVWNRK